MDCIVTNRPVGQPVIGNNCWNRSKYCCTDVQLKSELKLKHWMVGGPGIVNGYTHQGDSGRGHLSVTGR